MPRGQIDVVEQRPVQHDVAAALGVLRHAAELVEQEDVGAAEGRDAGAHGLDDASINRLGGGAGGQGHAGAGLVGRKDANRAATCSARASGDS